MNCDCVLCATYILTNVKMADVKIITFNCAGMANSIRRTALFEIFRRLPAQIILTQETHSKPEDEAIWAREWAPRTVVFNSAKNTTSYPRNGVAIFINDPIHKRWQETAIPT